MSEDDPEVPNADKPSGLPDPTGEGSGDLPTASDSGATQPHPNVWEEALQSIDPLDPGEQWGKYLIEKLLGKGGQAVVYQAFDVMGPAGHVALKIPRVRVPSNRVQAWVEAEVGPLTRLSHPHIVHVVDAGSIEDTPYIATQMAPDALPLDAYVKAHPPSRRQILTWMIQLTEAAGYAHDRGIIHRDLKPRNIVILPGGRPLIVDFGIASLVSMYQPQGETNSSGTPPFMAPEQARGDPDSDQRVDIFALGGVLKFLLEGVGPYGKTANAREAAKAGNIQKMDSGTGPGARRAMARIANRALEPEAKDRFATAAQMVQALRGARRRGVLRAMGAIALAAIALVVIALVVIEAVRWRDGALKDAWTSRPVTVWFYNDSAGGPDPEDELLVTKLAAAMVDRGRFKVVDRKVLDQILQELRLGSSDLADPSTALRLGKLLSARALVAVTVKRSAEETSISLRTVDVETSKVLGVTAEKIMGADDAAAVQRLVAGLEAVLEKAFPVRGRIATVTDGAVTLNIGRKVGVREGAVFSVFADEDSTGAIGELRVTSVRDDSSVAAVTPGTGQLKAGWRVQAKP